MRLTAQTLVQIATLGSAGLLAGAFVFQFLGWAPCALCLWQRWPHAVAVVLGAGIIASARPSLAPLGALAALAAAGLAGFHTGVERAWWPGPSSCTGGSGISGLSADQLLPGATVSGPAVVMCDQVTPFLLGLTMANWNLVWSAGLVAVWIAATLRHHRRA